MVELPTKNLAEMMGTRSNATLSESMPYRIQGILDFAQQPSFAGFEYDPSAITATLEVLSLNGSVQNVIFWTWC